MDAERAEAKRGRRRVWVALATFIGSDVAVIALSLTTRGSDRLPAQSVRFLLTCALAFFLYRGARWAHWTMIGLVSLAVMMLSSYELAAVYMAVISLLLRRDTRAFLEEQRSRNRTTPVVAGA
jgi:hypothetical protein